MTYTQKMLLPLLIVLIGLNGCVGLMVGGAATGVSVLHDRRSAGTILDDQNIEFQATNILHQDGKLLLGSHVNITSYNRAVLLTGEVKSRELGLKVAEIVQNMDKVDTVHNELVIAPPSAASSRNTDTLITTKVKTALFKITYLPDFDATRVKVVTERGAVYLMGLLRPREAEVTTEVVRQVAGVQKVVKLFEYIE